MVDMNAIIVAKIIGSKGGGGGGGSVTVDDEISASSTNPVQNRIIYSALNKKQNELTFDDIPTENSSNPVKSDGVYVNETLTRNMIATKEEGSGTHRTYGVQWNYGQSSTFLTRIEDAADFTDPAPATSYSGNGSSPFDNIAPWKDMKRYNIIDGQVSYSEDDILYSETEYDSVVYIPEFYYFSKKDTATQKWTWSISSEPIEGYIKHPGSGRYIGRFHTSGSSSAVFSKSGATPLTRDTRANFRTYSHNKGSKWYQQDLATWSAIQLLYLIEFANWNSQSMLGTGQVSGNLVNTGMTTGAKYHSIKIDNNSNMYRWVENPFSNLFTWTDGFTASNRKAYATTDANSFVDVTSGMSDTGITLPASQYITGLGYSDNYGWAFIPDSAGGGSSTTYISDYVDSNSSGVKVLYVGGSYVSADYFGMFYFSASGAASGSGSTIGSRLIYIP